MRHFSGFQRSCLWQSMLGPLYLSPSLAPPCTASSTPQSCDDDIQSMGTTPGGKWLIGVRKDESLSEANGGNSPYRWQGLELLLGCGRQPWVCTASWEKATLYKKQIGETGRTAREIHVLARVALL